MPSINLPSLAGTLDGNLEHDLHDRRLDHVSPGLDQKGEEAGPQKILTAENFPTDIDIVDKQEVTIIRQALDQVKVPEHIQRDELEKDK